MTEIISIGRALLEGGSNIALMGLLAILAVPKLRKKFFEGNGAQEEINKSMARHAETSNEELGTVKEDLKELKSDFKEHAKDDTERHDKVMSLLYEIKNK